MRNPSLKCQGRVTGYLQTPIKRVGLYPTKANGYEARNEINMEDNAPVHMHSQLWHCWQQRFERSHGTTDHKL